MTSPGANVPLKILFFDDRHYAAQGAQKLLVQLAVFARDLGLDVTVGSTRDGAFLDLARSKGLGVVELGVPEQLDRFEGALMASPAARLGAIQVLVRQNVSLARKIRTGGYDVVWAGAMRPMLSLLLTALLPRTPLVWQIMGSAYSRGLSEVAGLAADRIVVIAQGLRPAVGVFHDRTWMKRKIRVVQTGLPVPADIHSTRNQLRERLGLSPDTHRLVWIVSIGAHIAEKGHLDVVRAVEAMPETLRSRVLLLIGGPPLEGDYHDALLQAGETSAARINVHGWVDDVDEWLRAADVYVVASQREGMPLTLIEAMQRGVAAVGYPVGGVPELIRHGETGLLADEGSIEDLSKTLSELVQHPERARALAERAKRMVLADHTEESMRQKFQKVIGELTPKLDRDVHG